ncbi:MAG: DUF5719 family protein [Acidimicrobiales bacterium]
MNALRWPALIILPALLILVGVLDTRDRDEPDDAAAVEVVTVPVSGAPGDDGWSWYCPSGFVDPDGTTRLVLTNPTTSPSEVVLTVHTAVPNIAGTSNAQDPVVETLTVGAADSIDVELGPLATDRLPELDGLAEFAIAVLVETAEPEVVAEMVYSGPQRYSSVACTPSPADRWMLAAGTTQRGARHLLTLFNPFPDAAVVDVAFATDDGARRPDEFSNVVVGARSVLTLDIGMVVARREQVSTTVDVVSGRVVAGRIETWDGSEGLNGIELGLAARPALQWFFAAGSGPEGTTTSYVIYNPGERVAEVELEFQVDEAAALPVTPFPLTVPAGQRVVVVVNEGEPHPLPDSQVVSTAERLPEAVAHWAVVRSFNAQPVVVERVVTTATETTGVGVSTSLGTSLGATMIVVGNDASVAGPVPVIDVVNPSAATISRVSVSVILDGEILEVPSLSDVEVGPRRRAVIDLADHSVGQAEAFIVEATTPVIVETVRDGFVTRPGIPRSDTAVEPDLFSF